MGSDRLFRDHPPEERPRRRRLIDLIRPEFKRELKRIVSGFPPALKTQIKDMAKRRGDSPTVVMLYSMLCEFFGQNREERLRRVREIEIFADVSDLEIERATARLERAFNRELARMQGKQS